MTRYLRILRQAWAAGAMFCLLFSAAPAAAQTGERIESMDVDVTVHADGSIRVVETIVYVFPVPKHGIYRDLPEVYQDENGKRYTIPISFVSATDENGMRITAKEEDAAYGTRIRLGDADRTVTGTHVYVITYDASNALRYFEDHDELYWNASGTEWTVPIERVTATVHLPATVDAVRTNAACYTGAKGSTAEECAIARLEDGAVFFEANDFLTIVVGWPKGHVAQPSAAAASLTRPVFSLWPLLIPISAFVFLVRRWRRTGKEEGTEGALVVQYGPPEGARPADVGTLIDEHASVKEITATIVDLAVRGFIRIEEIEKRGIFSKSKDFNFVEVGGDRTADASLTSYEKKILHTIFGTRGSTVAMSTLTKSYAFNGVTERLYAQMYEETVLLGYFSRRPDSERRALYGLAALIAMGVFVVAFAGMLVIVGWVFTLALLMTAGILAAFAPLMSQKLPKGNAALAHARGFKEYLSRAEKYRLQWQESEKMFEAFLPYAMVFGVVDKYVKAFEGVQLPKPNWYEGSSGTGAFNAVSFSSAMNALSSGLNTAVLSKPQSTSSGSGFSGGSSGGGGGGGGGGSW